MNKDYRFKIISSIEIIEEQWLTLNKNNNSNIFQTYYWQYNWIKFCNKNNLDNTYLIGLYDLQENLLSIMPFIKKKVFKFSLLTFAGEPFLDYGDIIIEKKIIQNYSNFQSDLLVFLNKNIDIDLIFFDNIREDADILNFFSNNCIYEKNYSSYQIKNIQHKDFLISKKFEQDTRRQIRRISNFGKISFSIAKTKDELELIINFFIKHKEKQLKDTKNWNYLKKDVLKKFIQSLYSDLAISNISYVKINDIIISVHLGHIYNNKFYYLFPTYDPKYKGYSPGNILLYYLLTEKNLEINEIDLTTGDEPYKLKISNKKNKIFSIYYSLNIRGLFLKIFFLSINYIKNIKFINKIYRKFLY